MHDDALDGASPIRLGEGNRIGGYRLLRVLGEGAWVWSSRTRSTRWSPGAYRSTELITLARDKGVLR
jgi:hypothetical protein